MTNYKRVGAVQSLYGASPSAHPRLGLENKLEAREPARARSGS
jgi:hypothetical protein